VSTIAEAHVRATHSEAAGGERIIVRSGSFFHQDIREPFFLLTAILLRLNTPCEKKKKVDAAAEIPNIPRGEPNSTANIPISALYITTKAEDLLGLKSVTPLKDVVEESVKDFKARGYPGFTA